MHLPDERTAQLPRAVAAALAATDGVALELRMDLVSQIELGVRMTAPAGAGVADLAPPALVARLRALIVARHGTWAAVAHLRPWAAAVLLAFLPASTHRGGAIDTVLHDWALDHGKPSDGLETVAEQATLGNALSLADQLALLAEAVDRAEKGKDETAPLREAYFAGDERRTLAEMHDQHESRAARRLSKVMLDDRNVRLAERIRARLTAGGATFFAVGVAHLLGKGGIVERLRRAGYVLTPLR